MEKITELLDKRHKERKSRLDNIQELKSKEVSVNEGIEYFESVFDEKVREIQNNLNNLEAGDSSLILTFSKIGHSIQELQKFLSTSTFFLNDRKVQKCQETLNELANHMDTRKSTLIPKKKFGFKNRPKGVQVKQSDTVDGASDRKLPATVFAYTISDRENELIKFNKIESNEKDITVANIRNCVLQIEGHPGSLHIKNATNCIIVCGPVSRAIFGDNCQTCVFAIACQQLRLHSSCQCDIYLHVTSRGIIEDSSQIRVAPYNYNYADIDSDFVASGLPTDKNNWNGLQLVIG